MTPDPYEILGVSKDASQDDIRKAYRKLAHQYHPDKQGGNEAKFKELNAAYQILGNPDKRQQYDRFGAAGFGQGAPGGGGGFGTVSWEDFFRQGGFQGGFGNVGDLGDIFGDLFGFGGSRHGRQQTAGNSYELTLTIDFPEAVFGTSKTIELDAQHACARCDGTGREPGSGLKQCSTCRGAGQVMETRATLLGQFQTALVCPTCQGEGEVPAKRCTTCKGQGRERKLKRLEVAIPAGIADGQTLRLQGQGDAGPRGGRPGDVHILVRVRPDPELRRDGDDIVTRTTVSPADAALGIKVDVRTVDGVVEVKVPAGTQPGRRLRLKGKGVPSLRGRGRGDHLVEVVVKVPEKLSRKQKKLYEDLQDEE